MVRSYQENHVPQKNFIVKCYLGRKDLKGSQQKYTSMHIYIVRLDNFLQGIKNYALYLRRHWLNCSINSKTVTNNGVRKATSWIITQNRAMTAVSSSRTTETGSKKAGDMNLKKFRISKISLCNFPLDVVRIWQDLAKTAKMLVEGQRLEGQRGLLASPIQSKIKFIKTLPFTRQSRLVWWHYDNYFLGDHIADIFGRIREAFWVSLTQHFKL